jgi:twitching motility protein PilJ
MSTTAGAIRFERTAGVNLWLVLLLGAIGLLAANAYFAAERNKEDRQAIALTTDVQVLSQQVAKFATDAAAGNLDAFEELRVTRNRIDTIIRQLRQGDRDINMPGFASTPGVADDLDKVTRVWGIINEGVGRILGRQQLVLDLADSAEQFASRIGALQRGIDRVARALSERNAPSTQVYFAAQQMLRAERMLRSVSEILQGGELSFTAADRFGRDSRDFGRVLDGLFNGNPELNIRRITLDEALIPLGEVITVFGQVEDGVDEFLTAATELFEVKEAADKIFVDSQELLVESQRLAKSFGDLPDDRFFPSFYWAAAAVGLSILFVIMLVFTIFRDQRRRFAVTAELNQRNQEAILRLLDEMGSLAEGDLTVKATVTEDITGAIADSINFAVEALRSLVTTINETAVQVAAAAQETQATAMHLAEAAEHQAQQITSASAAINDIAVSIDEVSKNSAESADVAQRSVQIASKGAAIVRETIQGMDNIRDQIQETSKRIKRLGESSQEIGSIVELINDIAEQTNILALNAAIQAASAGEAGRGFAVVADEVQRLAERASNATKRIETLVQTIQSDTNEAVSSMEQTTAEVVAGARLAEDAGLALGEIEKVSNDLADLIQNISEAARQQSQAATNITSTMNVIQEITTQTSVGASQTAESIGNLAQLAADLRRSVADFKLPG